MYGLSGFVVFFVNISRTAQCSEIQTLYVKHVFQLESHVEFGKYNKRT